MKNRKMIIKSLLLIAGCLLVVNFMGLEAKAAIPEYFNIQGILIPRPDEGEDLNISIWDSESGGNQKWDITKAIVYSNPTPLEVQIDENGFFSLILPVSSYLGFDEPYYMEFKLINSNVIFPRQQVVSVPYAITARKLYGGTVSAESNVLGIPAIYARHKNEGAGIMGQSKGDQTWGALGGFVKLNNVDTYIGVGGWANENVGISTGVAGIGKTFGVQGLSPNIGMWGNSTGVQTLGQPWTGAGVYGSNTQTTIPSGKWPAAGVVGLSEKGPGVYAISRSDVPSTLVTPPTAVLGMAEKANDAANYGGYFMSLSNNGTGVAGWGPKYGGWFYSQNGEGIHVVAPENYFSGKVGINKESPAAMLYVVSSGPFTTVRAERDSENFANLGGQSTGVYGRGTYQGVSGQALGNAAVKHGVYGSAGGSGQYHYGLYGFASGGSIRSAGVYGGGADYAGYFSGKVHITGALSKGTGSFDIPHPDPAKGAQNWRLRHSFVESPTRGDNLYRWTVGVKGGEAIISLPDYFKYLNENVKVWVSPDEHFGRAYGKVNEALTQIVVKADSDGTYNVLAIGTRKDKVAKDFFDAKGVEYIMTEPEPEPQLQPEPQP